MDENPPKIESTSIKDYTPPDKVVEEINNLRNEQQQLTMVELRIRTPDEVMVDLVRKYDQIYSPIPQTKVTPIDIKEYNQVNASCSTRLSDLQQKT